MRRTRHRSVRSAELRLRLGVPGDWLAGAAAAGPLATFETTCVSADSPVMEGVALIGDAAGNVDPALGCGLSVALRDAGACDGASAICGVTGAKGRTEKRRRGKLLIRCGP